MSRGDQRERDRAKRQANEAAKSKGAGREGTPLLRNENDKAALEAKVAAKKAQAAEAESGTPTAAPVVRKKVPKKEDLNDLLSAGLTKVAKSKK